MAAGSITAAGLRKRYQAGGEIAIVDAREEGSFHNRHLLMATCLPLSRLELLAPGLLARRSVPIVVCDDGESLAERAATRRVLELESGFTVSGFVKSHTGRAEIWGPIGQALPSLDLPD